MFRSILVVWAAVTLLVFTLVSPVLAIAVPGPFPSLNSLDSRARRVSSIPAKHSRLKHTVNSGDAHSLNSTSTDSSAETRKHYQLSRDAADPVASMTPSYNQIMSSSGQLSTQAAAASADSGNFASQTQTLDSLNQMTLGLQTMYSILGPLAADKGLANYNKNDELETIIKNTINYIKNALTALSILLGLFPLLGPLLGPLIYQLKCITDDMLDLLENSTDGSLNSLGLTGIDNTIAGLLCSCGICPQ